ncbi:MAG: hypothetical protein NC218_01530 [Acetobacter sp.]|nr:hypothetical protein [Acetobacter sp.]
MMYDIYIVNKDNTIEGKRVDSERLIIDRLVKYLKVQSMGIVEEVSVVCAELGDVVFCSDTLLQAAHAETLEVYHYTDCIHIYTSRRTRHNVEYAKLPTGRRYIDLLDIEIYDAHNGEFLKKITKEG